MKKGLFITRNIMGFTIFIVLILFAVTSCREQKPKTETVIIEKHVETPKAKDDDGTSLKVDSDGVEFSTKNGKKKTEIIIKD